MLFAACPFNVCLCSMCLRFVMLLVSFSWSLVLSWLLLSLSLLCVACRASVVFWLLWGICSVLEFCSCVFGVARWWLFVVYCLSIFI